MTEPTTRQYEMAAAFMLNFANGYGSPELREALTAIGGNLARKAASRTAISEAFRRAA